MSEQTEIGAYEAKTHLSAYLRKADKGERFTITQRGRAVAELVPCGVSRQRSKQEAVLKLQAFMRKQAQHQPLDIKELIEHGRD